MTLVPRVPERLRQRILEQPRRIGVVVKDAQPRQVAPVRIADGRVAGGEPPAVEVGGAGGQVAHAVADLVAEPVALIQVAGHRVARAQVERPASLRGEVIDEGSHQRRADAAAPEALLGEDELQRADVAGVLRGVVAHGARDLAVDAADEVRGVQPAVEPPFHHVLADQRPRAEPVPVVGAVERRLGDLDGQRAAVAQWHFPGGGAVHADEDARNPPSWIYSCCRDRRDLSNGGPHGPAGRTAARRLDRASDPQPEQERHRR